MEEGLLFGADQSTPQNDSGYRRPDIAGNTTQYNISAFIFELHWKTNFSL